MPNPSLGPEQRDALLEVINIGAGNASSAISKLVSQKISLSVPELSYSPIEEIPGFIGAVDDIKTAILLTLTGDASGVILIMTDPVDASNLAATLTGHERCDSIICDPMDSSALLEFGNILTGAFITSLSNFLKLNILCSIPEMVTDMSGAVTNAILAELGQESDKILTFKVHIELSGESIGNDLFFFFNPEPSLKILKSLNNEY